jgi:hypothetical protein
MYVAAATAAAAAAKYVCGCCYCCCVGCENQTISPLSLLSLSPSFSLCCSSELAFTTPAADDCGSGSDDAGGFTLTRRQ